MRYGNKPAEKKEANHSQAERDSKALTDFSDTGSMLR